MSRLGTNTRLAPMLDIIALCLVITALLAYLNHRFVGLPTAIGVMATALGLSLVIVGLNALGVAHNVFVAEEKLLRSIDFSDVLLEGMLSLLLFAGALLITPGFFSDTVGLLLLIPSVRVGVMRLIGRRMTRVSRGFRPEPDATPHRYGHGVVIDGDYVEAEDTPPAPPGTASRQPSGWTRH